MDARDQEIQSLKSQLSLLQAQRTEERARYHEAMSHITTFQTYPDDLATRGSQIACEAVETAAERYFSLAHDIDLNRPIATRITTPEIDALRADLAFLSTSLAELQTIFQFGRRSAHDQRNQFQTVHDTQSVVLELRNTLHGLGNNANSFAEFLVSYINGRHEIKNLGRGLVPQLRQILEPFFAEKSDVKQLIARILKCLSEGIRVDGGEIGSLTEDLMRPVGEVLRDLAKVVAVVEVRLAGVR